MTPHPANDMHYVYALKNRNDNSFYYGYTNNLEWRIAEHQRDWNCELIYWEAYKSEIDARRRERKLQDYGQALSALKLRLAESLK